MCLTEKLYFDWIRRELAKKLNDLVDQSNRKGKKFKSANYKVMHLGTNNKNLCYNIGSSFTENDRGGGKLVCDSQSQEAWMMCCVCEKGKEGYIR